MFIVIFLSLIGILFITGIIVLVVWLIKKSSSRTHTSLTPVEEAQGRYARGEIAAAEFEEIKRNLT